MHADIPGLFKVSFNSMRMALVNKLALLCSAFKIDHPEAQKACFLVLWMCVKHSFIIIALCSVLTFLCISRVTFITIQYCSVQCGLLVALGLPPV